MKNLSNKNLTKEELLEKLSTPKNIKDEDVTKEKNNSNKSKNNVKRKRVYPGFPDAGLKTGPRHPLILKLGGFPDGKKFI